MFDGGAMSQAKVAILVLEDEDEVREAISETLSNAGFRVETAVNGWEAIALAEEHRFDMVVADINLPGGLTGLQTARHVRVRHPSLKCLFISGWVDPVVCDPELDDFVAKPFRPFELLGCVWKVLRGNLPNPRLNIASPA